MVYFTYPPPHYPTCPSTHTLPTGSTYSTLLNLDIPTLPTYSTDSALLLFLPSTPTARLRYATLRNLPLLYAIIPTYPSLPRF
eukprot:6071854-Pyramimonas_sp.AAC.1